MDSYKKKCVSKYAVTYRYGIYIHFLDLYLETVKTIDLSFGKVLYKKARWITSLQIRYFTSYYSIIRTCDTPRDIVVGSYFSSRALPWLYLINDWWKDAKFRHGDIFHLVLSEIYYKQISDFKFLWHLHFNIQQSDTNN